MQGISIYTNTPDGLKPMTADMGPQGAAMARIKASFELEQKTLLRTMMDNAVRHKDQGNSAMAHEQHRHAIREYNKALEHAHAMMEHLEIERPPPMNGYQLRALARGQPLPKRGPESLNEFRALVHSNRGLAFLKLDAYAQATEDLQRACQLEPKYLKAWVRLSAALVADNRVGQALEVLNTALSLACPNEAAKEEVCNLIVSIRSLGKIEVKPPEKDLPVVYKDSGQKKKKKPKREMVKVPLGSPSKTGNSDAQKSPTMKGGDASEPVFAEVDARDLDIFLREDWHATHLGGRWRQTREEVTVVLDLPRRPKPSELRVQIRPQRIWVMLQREGTKESYGAEDYDTIIDLDLAGVVKPSDSCWILESGASTEIHFTLQKQSTLIDHDRDNVTPHLWDRVFNDDSPIDVSAIAAAKAEQAKQARSEVKEGIKKVDAEAKSARADGREEDARQYERLARNLRQRMGL